MTLVMGAPAATGPADETASRHVAPPAPPSAIEVRQLTKRYGDIVAIDALDLSVPVGSVFGFLGPNGAGKTTTLRLLTGLGRPTSGGATVAGIPVDSGGLELARRIGYLGQEPRFYGWMTGRELLELSGRAYGSAGTSLRTRVDEVLEVIGLADAARRRIGTYSGGMRQRLGIGQAILPSPSVLFLDEPVSALDPAGRRDVLELIGGLRGSATILMSSHILNDIERVCDRIAIIDRGRLVTEAPIDELLARHARPILELDPEPGQDGTLARLVTAMRSAAWAKDVRVEHGVVRVSVSDAAHARSEALPMLVAAQVSVMRFEWVRPSLEDVFLELVGENGTTRETDPATLEAGAGARSATGSPP